MSIVADAVVVDVVVVLFLFFIVAVLENISPFFEPNVVTL